MRLLLLALGMMGLAATSASAQSGAEGLLNAVAYKPVPANAAVTVRPLDNSDENMVLKVDFEDSLRKRGFIVGADAPLILSFETRNVEGAYTNRPSQRWDDLDRKGGSAPGAEGTDGKPKLPFFNSPSGGLVPRGDETRDTQVITPTQRRLDATVEERASGQRLWHGWALADLSSTDRQTVMRAMAAEVALSVGETVRQKPFPVP